MRRRNSYRRSAGRKRPVNKSIITVSSPIATGSQLNEELYEAEYPSTFQGLLWDFTVTAFSETNSTSCAWAVIRVKDGLLPGALMFTSSGQTLVKPEQEVMACGLFQLNPVTIPNGYNLMRIHGDTKTKRKLAQGDRVYFLIACDNNAFVAGNFQFFNLV